MVPVTRSPIGLGYSSAPVALVRAAADCPPDVPPWPALAGSAGGGLALAEWLEEVWACHGFAEAIGHASPALASEVAVLCRAADPDFRKARRAALSVYRYLLRLRGRATPFGLLAGVAVATFGTNASARWRGSHVVCQGGASWLAVVIAELERCPDLLARLPVVASSALTMRGERLIVPYRPGVRERGTGAVEVSIRSSPPLRAALQLAREPVRLDDLVSKLRADFPGTGAEKITRMLTGLVTHGALITSLQAPGTETDALEYLFRQLDLAEASEIAAVARMADGLAEISSLVRRHNEEPGRQNQAAREAIADQMRAVCPAAQHPLAIDLRLDAGIVLPAAVAREAQRAALVLARLSACPFGTAAWRAYHQRFYERFGLGALVPLLDVVADSGIGWPDGYPGTVDPPARSPLSARDDQLLALAQHAAVTGIRELALDDKMIASLELADGPPRLPPHLELGIRVLASDTTALQRGRFRLQVVTVSRGAGILTGRFLPVIAQPDRAAFVSCLVNLPAADTATSTVQLSFPPLDPATAHVTRVPQVLPDLISHAEHRQPRGRTLTASDLAIGCDGRRMYLAIPGRGQRIEAVSLHALNLLTHTPPLARLISELSRAHCAQVTTFDWGAARHLPYLPRIVAGRTILSAARWRLRASDLPPLSSPPGAWESALTEWRNVYRVPPQVELVEGDQALPVNLDHLGDREVLRAHLAASASAVLAENPDPGGQGWCGGRAHEVIVMLTAKRQSSWPGAARAGERQGDRPRSR